MKKQLIKLSTKILAMFLTNTVTASWSATSPTSKSITSTRASWGPRSWSASLRRSKRTPSESSRQSSKCSTRRSGWNLTSQIAPRLREYVRRSMQSKIKRRMTRSKKNNFKRKEKSDLSMRLSWDLSTQSNSANLKRRRESKKLRIKRRKWLNLPNIEVSRIPKIIA